MTVPASAALDAKLSLLAPALGAASTDLWSTADRPRYLAYLRGMLAVLRASVPLLERAARRCAELPSEDPTAVPLARYYARHAEEERGHDVWLLEDLAAAGAAAAALPEPLAVELAGAQYYLVEHHHPVALLGYIAVLEGNAPAPWLADRLTARTGLPEAAFRTLREHAELDGGHRAELAELLDTLALTPTQRAAIGANAIRSADLLIQLFRRLAGAGASQGEP
ncbi:MAG TPA: iron-containing redox enzyme family protein [Actinospica sp.]|nr:iron-containing redox enzyme family protein [Actinospica sp.]